VGYSLLIPVLQGIGPKVCPRRQKLPRRILFLQLIKANSLNARNRECCAACRRVARRRPRAGLALQPDHRLYISARMRPVLPLWVTFAGCPFFLTILQKGHASWRAHAHLITRSATRGAEKLRQIDSLTAEPSASAVDGFGGCSARPLASSMERSFYRRVRLSCREPIFVYPIITKCGIGHLVARFIHRAENGQGV